MTKKSGAGAGTKGQAKKKGVTIDKVAAARILDAEASSTDAISLSWGRRTNKLATASAGNETFIAVLGTAILARCVSADVDVFSLKSSSGPGGYSARSLCKDVLAAKAPRLGISLGVSGREPLNNQPFFAEARISNALPVKAAAREALALLLDALGELSKLTPSDARGALRAFIAARRKDRTAVAITPGQGNALTEAKLLKVIESFVNSDSENGKRAQAVAAGLLDVVFGKGRVSVGGVFDPSRYFPGDVAILTIGRDDQYDMAFEVRDKLVVEADLDHFSTRAEERKVGHVVMVAIAAAQKPFDTSAAEEFAASKGVKLFTFFGWRNFVRRMSFEAPVGANPGAAFRAILTRLSDLQVSDTGIELWRSSAI